MAKFFLLNSPFVERGRYSSEGVDERVAFYSGPWDGRGGGGIAVKTPLERHWQEMVLCEIYTRPFPSTLTMGFFL